MMPFGERWLFGTEGEPVRLYDRETGRRVHPVVVDRESGEPLDPRRLVAGPGPSFPSDEGVRRERFSDYYRALRDGHR
jgi:hypothetical protein